MTLVSRNVGFAAKRCLLPCLMLSAAPLLAQGGWSRLPPTPTSCFTNDDHFLDVAEQVRTDIAKEIEPQKAYRSDMQQKLNAIDPMTKSSRMVAYLQKDPSKAQEYMKLMGAGSNPPPVPDQWTTKRTELEQRFQTMESDYLAEVKKLEPLRAEVRTKYGEDQNNPKALALIANWNAKYKTLCETRISSGPFASWLKDFKQFQVEMVPIGVENENREKLQYEIFGLPMTGYKTTAELERVEEYTRVMARVYRLRQLRLKPY